MLRAIRCPRPAAMPNQRNASGLILRDALAVEQDLPEQCLRFDHALTRREQNRLGRTGRAFVEHGAELFAVEDFLAAQ